MKLKILTLIVIAILCIGLKCELFNPPIEPPVITPIDVVEPPIIPPVEDPIIPPAELPIEPSIPPEPVEPPLTQEEIDILQFERGVRDGFLYMSDNTMDMYEELKGNLVNKFSDYLENGELMTQQEIQLYMQIASKEAGKDDGWRFTGVTGEIFLNQLNDRLKTKVYGE